MRDLLAGHPVRDVDLVVEGDGVEFARALAQRLRAPIRAHERFGTATLTLSAGNRLDVASTRRESYAAPGALPAVAFPASIAEDLARRDFTVNAMALALAPGRGLVDPYGGRADLAGGVLRALHDASFRDDPTRALRAVRYANRYGFRLDSATGRAMREAAKTGVFARVSGDRLRRELIKILEEPGRASAVRRLRGLGLDLAIAPPLARVKGAGARLNAVEALSVVATDGEGVTWLAYLLAWMGTLPARDVREVARRLDVSGTERARLLAWPATRRRLSRGLARRRPSEIAKRTAGLSRDELVAAAAGLAAPDRRVLRKSLAPGSRGRLSIRGADLLAAGIPPGEAIGRALARTRDALLDRVIAPEEELAFALREARRRRRRT